MRATGRDEQEVSRLERHPLGIAAEHAGVASIGKSNVSEAPGWGRASWRAGSTGFYGAPSPIVSNGRETLFGAR
jgi:hypothetical protein